MSRSVHPRACGERVILLMLDRTRRGSSPRLRGTRHKPAHTACPLRFIPAPAGNARWTSASPQSRTVHPRACGERDGCSSTASHPCGSSPRLRGTRRRHQQRCRPLRFIPAPAGNAAARRISSASPYGSSPRLRGTRFDAGLDVGAGRFIPAPAGNAVAVDALVFRGSVHPRACGERYDSITNRLLLCGSSPRLRGTLTQAAQDRALKRFIPAPAGNAPQTLRAALPKPVHPRACGERTSSISMSFNGNISPSKSTNETACKRHFPSC